MPRRGGSINYDPAGLDIPDGIEREHGVEEGGPSRAEPAEELRAHRTRRPSPRRRPRRRRGPPTGSTASLHYRHPQQPPTRAFRRARTPGGCSAESRLRRARGYRRNVKTADGGRRGRRPLRIIWTSST